MSTVTFIFTRRRFNPVSWLIRWVMPRSRFALALSSHLIVDAGAACYEAHMIHGVRRVSRDVALHGLIVVRERVHHLPNVRAAMGYADSLLCTYVPRVPGWVPAWLAGIVATALLMANNNYDFKGALGLGLAPGESWADPACFFCYEFGGAFLRAGGRDVFGELDRLSETALLAINP